ncbi:amino acid permease [Lentilactobacillus farraginis]|uniref:Amino acid metabolite permease n=1 Tax=Lentilactobacillus farraginis DSM 18382 = JCM 14108 TaxID=1423743 RepID=X0PM05_9LACO|nr:amino acid permease [Lentilactobacillus farraginis]KRM06646.1 amino acid metabolite permease [Lentilactobacillus farraginis DSM 18382 = JCM 14108]GAF37856.1 amino acid transporter [Lentilactobacillus farraginis DSM 18382 = JCM 14108]
MMLFGFAIIFITVIMMLAILVKATDSVRKWKLRSGSLLQNSKSFGYKQELVRDMGGFSNFAVSFSIISILTGAVSYYGYGFSNGGPAMMGIGWPLVTFFVLLVAAAMAELTSAIPTSGAIYHWAAILGGPTWGWFTGWLNVIGQVTIVAGIDYGCATFAASLLFTNPSKPVFLLTYAVILGSHAILNHVGINIVSKLNSISAIYHVIGVFLIIGVLAVLGPQHSGTYLFHTFSTTTSQSLPYWGAFMIGLLQAQWTLTGYDASAHTSEETLNPKIQAPWGVYLSVAISGIFGFLLLSLVTVSIKDPTAVANAGNNAFIVAIEQAAGSRLGSAMVWLVTIAMWFCGCSSLTSSSRMVYAFSRDGGLPFSKTWKKVSHHFHTPATAIWLIAVLAFLFGTSDGVYAAIGTMSVIGLYGSYLIPIALKLRARILHVWTKKEDGPWSLGNWSIAVSAVACGWIVFLILLMIFSPTDVQLTSNLVLHYATGKIFVVVLIALVIDFMVYAKRRFKGPKLGSYAALNKQLTAKRDTLRTPLRPSADAEGRKDK